MPLRLVRKHPSDVFVGIRSRHDVNGFLLFSW
jgi:hypothetical protein